LRRQVNEYTDEMRMKVCECVCVRVCACVRVQVNEYADEMSVRERVSVRVRVQVNEYADEMRRKNKKEADINSACKLFTQIQKVIESKQLGPTVRTQYMRTAFQIPFDSSVSRPISLSLSLTLSRACAPACATSAGPRARYCAFATAHSPRAPKRCPDVMAAKEYSKDSQSFGSETFAPIKLFKDAACAGAVT
jgi:hypothetical protein